MRRHSTQEVKGSIPEIIRNPQMVYEGDMKFYFKVLWENARNLGNSYHNLRHILHVLYLCYSACLYYGQALTKRQKRNILIGAIFHDFDHTGRSGPDSMNIAIALRAINQYLLPEDRAYQQDIERLVITTEFPYRVPAEELDLTALILRDADMGQTFSVAWLQQVILGLAKEWGKTPLEVLKMQGPFLEKLKIHTAWGQMMFPPEVIQQKIEEAEELLELLEEPTVLT